ncbi:hypothetical protein [Gemmatimonas sp.]|jgi:hypothetical protein|uniref:hypothetical protein n=1 Tax=Gemmatimonas sp. TaxID=1962908 RepID=UPI0037BEDBCD
MWLTLRAACDAGRDHGEGVASYKRVLTPGGVRPLPEPDAVAWVKRMFDAETMADLVAFLEGWIEAMRAVADAPFAGIGIGISIGAGRLSVEYRARSPAARAPTGGWRRAR